MQIPDYKNMSLIKEYPLQINFQGPILRSRPRSQLFRLFDRSFLTVSYSIAICLNLLIVSLTDTSNSHPTNEIYLAKIANTSDKRPLWHGRWPQMHLSRLSQGSREEDLELVPILLLVIFVI